MIGYLSGTVLEKEGASILVDVNGVGYLVYVSDVGIYTSGNDVKLYIYTHVKEDDISLFGFDSLAQKRVFQMLISVSGIGSKTGLAILGHGSSTQIRQAVIQGNVDFFQSVSGIGKKTAQRVIIDLKSKVGSVAELDLSEPEIGSDDVFDALVTMGFDPKRTHKTLKEIDRTVSEQDQIKSAIKLLSNQG